MDALWEDAAAGGMQAVDRAGPKKRLEIQWKPLVCGCDWSGTVDVLFFTVPEEGWLDPLVGAALGGEALGGEAVGGKSLGDEALGGVTWWCN